MGAMRIRQLRSKPVDCIVPDNLKKVNNVTVDCQIDYSKSTALMDPIYLNEDSLEFQALGDFYLPFK